MIYLPKLKTKIYLIALCGIICLHIIFLATKSYNADYKNRSNDYYQIRNATEDQYQSCLSSITKIEDRVKYIDKTEIRYLYVFPKGSLIFIYLGYFLIVTGLILSAKFNLNESSNEN